MIFYIIHYVFIYDILYYSLRVYICYSILFIWYVYDFLYYSLHMYICNSILFVTYVLPCAVRSFPIFCDFHDKSSPFTTISSCFLWLPYVQTSCLYRLLGLPLPLALPPTPNILMCIYAILVVTDLSWRTHDIVFRSWHYKELATETVQAFTCISPMFLCSFKITITPKFDPFYACILKNKRGKVVETICVKKRLTKIFLK